MTASLHHLTGHFTPPQVEQLFTQWRDDNAEAHVYSFIFDDDGRAAYQFDQLKFNWFERSPSDLINANS